MIDKGSYIRKKNWQFFKNFYRSGKIEFLPAIEIISIQQHDPESVSIHGVGYKLDELVEITKEEAESLNSEYASMELKSCEGDEQVNAHVRKDNGDIKVSHEKGYALRYCFTFNHKNPGVIMNAYTCPVCSQIHCGTSKPVENGI